MAQRHDTPTAALSMFRLFCLAFVFTFAGVMTHLAAFQLVWYYLDSPQELMQPSRDEEPGWPRLADVRNDGRRFEAA